MARATIDKTFTMLAPGPRVDCRIKDLSLSGKLTHFTAQPNDKASVFALITFSFILVTLTKALN